MSRPSREDMLTEIAFVVAKRSTCNRLNVGAVIALEARVLSMGYNGPPSGIEHCQHENGEPCAQAVHAEANAIVFAARHGIPTQCTQLYVTHMPCLACAQLIINAGIVELFYSRPYRDQAGLDLLRSAGIDIYTPKPAIGGPQWTLVK